MTTDMAKQNKGWSHVQDLQVCESLASGKKGSKGKTNYQ